jgi:two-component sensor histidine kinase
VIHEVATESMEYGALSVPSGTLDLSSALDGADIVLT